MTLAVLPLYFEEEDEDIWLRLLAVAPEAQQGLIKEALRQFLGSETGIEQDISSDLKLQDLFARSGQEGMKEEKEVLKPWERLLNEVVGLEEDESVIAAIQALQSQTVDGPESVAEQSALTAEDSASTAEDSASTAEDSASTADDSVSTVDVSDSVVANQESFKPWPGHSGERSGSARPQSQNLPLSQAEGAVNEGMRPLPVSKGMAHLMEVIGEEEDDEVLAFLQRSG